MSNISEVILSDFGSLLLIDVAHHKQGSLKPGQAIPVEGPLTPADSCFLPRFSLAAARRSRLTKTVSADVKATLHDHCRNDSLIIILYDYIHHVIRSIPFTGKPGMEAGPLESSQANQPTSPQHTAEATTPNIEMTRSSVASAKLSQNSSFLSHLRSVDYHNS